MPARAPSESAPMILTIPLGGSWPYDRRIPVSWMPGSARRNACMASWAWILRTPTFRCLPSHMFLCLTEGLAHMKTHSPPTLQRPTVHAGMEIIAQCHAVLDQHVLGHLFHDNRMQELRGLDRLIDTKKMLIRPNMRVSGSTPLTSGALSACQLKRP